MFLLLLFRSIRASPGVVNRRISERHTREQVNRRIGEKMGPARWRLYGMIGDQLDQMSGWERSMDVVMRVIGSNPRAVLNFLIETHGEDRVRQMMRDLLEEDRG